MLSNPHLAKAISAFLYVAILVFLPNVQLLMYSVVGANVVVGCVSFILSLMMIRVAIEIGFFAAKCDARDKQTSQRIRMAMNIALEAEMHQIYLGNPKLYETLYSPGYLLCLNIIGFIFNNIIMWHASSFSLMAFAPIVIFVTFLAAAYVYQQSSIESQGPAFYEKYGKLE